MTVLEVLPAAFWVEDPDHRCSQPVVKVREGEKRGHYSLSRREVSRRGRQWCPRFSQQVSEGAIPRRVSSSRFMEAAWVPPRWLEALRRRAPTDASPAVLETALRSARHVMQRAGPQDWSDLLQMISQTKDPRAHALVRDLAVEGYQSAVTVLASFRDVRDWPPLGGMLRNAPDRIPYLAPAVSRSDMVEVLKNQNPDLRAADDAALAAFVNARAGANR